VDATVRPPNLNACTCPTECLHMITEPWGIYTAAAKLHARENRSVIFAPLPSVNTATVPSEVRIASGLWAHGGMIWNSSLNGPVGLSLMASTTSLLVVQCRSVQSCVISAANIAYCNFFSLPALLARLTTAAQAEHSRTMKLQECKTITSYYTC
jgi:hypothetical protein